MSWIESKRAKVLLSPRGTLSEYPVWIPFTEYGKRWACAEDKGVYAKAKAFPSYKEAHEAYVELQDHKDNLVAGPDRGIWLRDIRRRGDGWIVLIRDEYGKDAFLTVAGRYLKAGEINEMKSAIESGGAA